MNITELAKCPETLKVYQTMFRTVKESETVDWRQHCFLVQSSGAGPAGGGGAGAGAGGRGPRYFSAETRRELLRVEAAWTANIVNSVIRLGVSGGAMGCDCYPFSTISDRYLCPFVIKLILLLSCNAKMLSIDLKVPIRF